MNTEKVHYYEIGYHSYEESEYYKLVHERKFSKKEFEDICIETCNAALEKIASGEIKDHCGYYDAIAEKPKAALTFQSILGCVVKELESKGFRQITFDANCVVFGWANLFDREDWKDCKDEVDFRLVDGLDKKVLEKVSERLRRDHKVEL